MSVWWVDLDSGNDGNTGASDTLPWLTASKAATSTSVNAGDTIIIRNGTSEAITAMVDFSRDGTMKNPIHWMGKPRNSSSTTGDFTNGSRQVNNVAVALVEGSHGARYITAPDGKRYMTAKIVDANTLMLLNEYEGSTDTTVSFDFNADDDYAWYDALGVGDGRTGAWDSDSEVLPLFDFGNLGNIYFQVVNDENHNFTCLQFKDPASFIYGALNFSSVGTARVSGCIFMADGVATAFMEVNSVTSANIQRCIFYGYGAGGSNASITFSGKLFLKDVSMYDCSITYLYFIQGVPIYTENCNFGTDSTLVTTSYIHMGTNSTWLAYHKNCSFGNYTLMGQARTTSVNPSQIISIESYNKDPLDNRKYFTNIGQAISNDGSGADVDLPSGVDSVLEVLLNNHADNVGIRQPEGVQSFGMAPVLLDHNIFKIPAGTHTFTYLVNSVGARANTELWLEATTSEIGLVTKSSEAVSVRSGVTDWTQSISVTFTLATEGSVNIRGYGAWYHATEKTYINTDPAVA